VHLKSLETLDLRMRAHSDAAARSPIFLSLPEERATRALSLPPRSPAAHLARAQMDAGGGVVAFEIEGGKKAAFKAANALKLIDISNNLGDAKSLITHPRPPRTRS